MKGQLTIKTHKKLDLNCYSKIIIKEKCRIGGDNPIDYKMIPVQEGNIRRFYKHVSRMSRYNFKDIIYNCNIFVELK